MSEYRVLVCEDEIEIGNAIEIYLRNQGYEVLRAENGITGLETLKNEIVHLAIIDIMMPEMDGIQMIMQMRNEYDFPVIVLSAKSQDIDKITALNIGADDYVTKPFTPMELLARVQSQLRRYSKYLELKNSADEGSDDVYAVGGLEINVATKDVSVDGELVKLTPIEFKILHLLIKDAGRVFSAEEIYEKVWQEEAIATETVMVHIRNIREKIEIDSKNPQYLKVVWGVGYKIERR